MRRQNYSNAVDARRMRTSPSTASSSRPAHHIDGRSPLSGAALGLSQLLRGQARRSRRLLACRPVARLHGCRKRHPAPRLCSPGESRESERPPLDLEGVDPTSLGLCSKSQQPESPSSPEHSSEGEHADP
jgi:hypothetical protein